MTKPVPFKIVTDDAYAVAFAATCTPSETRRGVQLTGTCPRCGHPMDFLVPTSVYQRPVRAVLNTNQPEPVLCTCTAPHPGTPAGEEGCGAYWNVELTESAP